MSRPIAQALGALLALLALGCDPVELPCALPPTITPEVVQLHGPALPLRRVVIIENTCPRTLQIEAACLLGEGVPARFELEGPDRPSIDGGEQAAVRVSHVLEGFGQSTATLRLIIDGETYDLPVCGSLGAEGSQPPLCAPREPPGAPDIGPDGVGGCG